MEITDVKMKKTKPRGQGELNRVYCKQVPYTSLSKDQREALANERGGPRHAKRLLKFGRTRLGGGRGTFANIPR